MKRRIADLALFGGPPCFSEPLHVGRPNIGDRAVLLGRIESMLDRGCLTNGGPYVQELERRLAEQAGVPYCVATGNATVALEIAARALGLRGEVIVPSFTFVATAHALWWQGIRPVFCDIDPRTHNLDPECVEALITPRTTGIVGVHVWGRACDVEALGAIAARHRLRVLYDAAHGLGCSRNGRMIGSFGDAEVLSFHATKFVNAFEGGALLTNDGDLAARVRLMANFGFADYDEVTHLGTNGKMSEASAAMGLTSLESMDAFVTHNRENHRRYAQALDGLPGIALVRYDSAERNNYQYVVFEIDENVAGLSRDVLLRVLHGENVLARRYFYPGCHRMEPYRTEFPEAGARLPHTEALAARVLCLPTGTAVDGEAVDCVGEVVRFAATHAAEITARAKAAGVVAAGR